VLVTDSSLLTITTQQQLSDSALYTGYRVGYIGGNFHYIINSGSNWYKVRFTYANLQASCFATRTVNVMNDQTFTSVTTLSNENLDAFKDAESFYKDNITSANIQTKTSSYSFTPYTEGNCGVMTFNGTNPITTYTVQCEAAFSYSVSAAVSNSFYSICTIDNTVKLPVTGFVAQTQIKNDTTGSVITWATLDLSFNLIGTVP